MNMNEWTKRIEYEQMDQTYMELEQTNQLWPKVNLSKWTNFGLRGSY